MVVTVKKEKLVHHSKEEKRRRAKKMSWLSTVLPQKSPWNMLYFRGDQQAFRTVTGLDPQCFHELLTVFTSLFESNSPYSRNQDSYIRRINWNKKRGCPRVITAHACLGLVLYWMRTTAFYWEMSGYFGLVILCCSLWLRFGKQLLLQILLQRTDVQVQMP